MENIKFYTRYKKSSEVDDFLKNSFEDRLTSMMQLRMKMETLTTQQKKEEALYVKTIKDILRRNAVEKFVKLLNN